MRKFKKVLKACRFIVPFLGFRKLAFTDVRGLGLDDRYDWASFEFEWMGQTYILSIRPVQPAHFKDPL